jgi:hypothetical protein
MIDLKLINKEEKELSVLCFGRPKIYAPGTLRYLLPTLNLFVFFLQTGSEHVSIYKYRRQSPQRTCLTH